MQMIEATNSSDPLALGNPSVLLEALDAIRAPQEIPIIEWYQLGTIGSSTEEQLKLAGGYGLSSGPDWTPSTGAMVIALCGTLVLGSGGTLKATPPGAHQAPTAHVGSLWDREPFLGPAVEDWQPHRHGAFGQRNRPVGTDERLRSIQEFLSLNVTEVAWVLNVSRRSVYGWLRGSNPYSAATQRLAALSDIAMEWSDRSDEPLGAYVSSPVSEGCSVKLLLREFVSATDQSTRRALKARLTAALSTITAEQEQRRLAATAFGPLRMGDQRSLSEIIGAYSSEATPTETVKRRVRLTSQRARGQA